MVVIVGAGISGLALAHALEARGVEHVVLEASERVGGVIRSARVDGHVLEWGPQRARLTRDMARLVDELGLRDRMIEAPRDLQLFVFREGRLRRVPFSLRDLLRTDLLSWQAKLRLLAEPLTRAARDDESVGRALRRKLGREAYESFAGPLYGGLYASDPDDMIVGLSLSHTLRELGVRRSMLVPALRRGRRGATPPAISFEDGLEELPHALYERHRARIRLNSPVRSVERAQRGYVVATDGARIPCGAVVVTVPAPAAAQILGDVVPAAAAGIGRLTYNPLPVVHVHAQTTLRGLGYQVSFAESMVTRGVTFNDALFGRAGVHTIFLGGARNDWVVDASEERLARIAVGEFRQATGVDARVLSVAHVRMPAWDRSWRAVEALELPAGIHLHANWSARPGLPGRLAASRRLADRLVSRSDRSGRA